MKNNSLRIVWIVISIVILVYVLLRIVDIGISLKYEVEEPLMGHNGLSMKEKGEILEESMRTYLFFGVYLFLNILLLFFRKSMREK